MGGIFAQPKPPLASPPQGLAWTALVLAALWNVLLIARTVSFSLAGEDSATDLVKYIDAVGSGGAFLIAGVLTFFFGKSTEPGSPMDEH